MLGMFLISLASAEGNLGVFKQRDKVQLYQICDTCTYVNITSIIYPNSTVLDLDASMARDGTDYTYSFSDTVAIGTYTYTVCGDKDGGFSCEEITFEITPTGLGSNLGFYILVLILSLGIIVFGASRNDPVITLLGSFGLYFLGLYILFNGIVGVKDLTTTWAIGIILLGLAMYVSIKSAYSLITD